MAKKSYSDDTNKQVIDDCSIISKRSGAHNNLKVDIIRQNNYIMVFYENGKNDLDLYYKIIDDSMNISSTSEYYVDKLAITRSEEDNNQDLLIIVFFQIFEMVMMLKSESIEIMKNDVDISDNRITFGNLASSTFDIISSHFAR